MAKGSTALRGIRGAALVNDWMLHRQRMERSMSYVYLVIAIVAEDDDEYV